MWSTPTCYATLACGKLGCSLVSQLTDAAAADHCGGVNKMVWATSADRPEPVRVVAPVAQQPLRSWQAVQQSGGAGVVADLARCHEEPDRAAERIGDGVQLRVQPALRAPDQAPASPFFARRLEAVRCAFR